MMSNQNGIYRSNWEILKSISQTVFNLNKENFTSSVSLIIEILNDTNSNTISLIIAQIISSAYIVLNKDISIYLNFIKEIEQFQEYNQFKFKIMVVFINYLLRKNRQESNYLLGILLEEDLIDIKVLQDTNNPYFAQFISKEYFVDDKNPFIKEIIDNYDDLSANDWELHNRYIKEAVNPNEVSKIIRNDDITKFQEISSQSNFDFNQIIQRSVYEKCSFIDQEDLPLIDFAAFFGAIECFKYLLLNCCKPEKTGKYAVAGGNYEIIHLCEQHHSKFDEGYEAAIEFHRNDIFYYLYENKICTFRNLEELGKKCIVYHNYEILAFLMENGMNVNETVLCQTSRVGNLFLIKHFNKPLPSNLIIFAAESGNIEYVDYVLKQGNVNINITDSVSLFDLIL